MIVLKATQDLVLKALQAVVSIVRARPALSNIICRSQTAFAISWPIVILKGGALFTDWLDLALKPVVHVRATPRQSNLARSFFSAFKVNARNAP